jgi:dTDP-4-amino-4,6-dideoxygalactose transaminase
VIEVRMIEYKKPYFLDHSFKYIEDAIGCSNGSGDGIYTERCETWIKNKLGVKHLKMTTSCTHALELALQVIELNKGDEVILPSYTYPSTANAVLLAGGQVVFSEVESKHLTLDPTKLESKITSNTKAIIVVHYGGICCKMDEIMSLAKKHHLVVIEDGAQSFLSQYKGRYAGTLGDFACLSFHGTKDVVAGEAGALLFHDDKYITNVNIFRQKGTNQASYKTGLVDFYEWKSKGSSYAPSDFLMAILLGQLELSQEIIECNQKIFENYEKHFKNNDYIGLQNYSRKSEFGLHNGHLFYLIFWQVEQASAFIKYMADENIQVLTHFVPLYESEMGRTLMGDTQPFEFEKNMGRRLVRLPVHPLLDENQQKQVLFVADSFLRRLI